MVNVVELERNLSLSGIVRVYPKIEVSEHNRATLQIEIRRVRHWVGLRAIRNSVDVQNHVRAILLTQMDAFQQPV